MGDVHPMANKTFIITAVLVSSNSFGKQWMFSCKYRMFSFQFTQRQYFNLYSFLNNSFKSNIFCINSIIIFKIRITLRSSKIDKILGIMISIFKITFSALSKMLNVMIIRNNEILLDWNNCIYRRILRSRCWWSLRRSCRGTRGSRGLQSTSPPSYPSYYISTSHSSQWTTET